jgi:acyl-homoserine-lactone acylase
MGPEFGLPWTAGGVEGPGRAFVFADPNAGNLRVLDTWFGFNHARDVHDVLAAVRETQGVPWWTVIAADAQGETLFSQIQVVANVPDEHLERCLTPLGRALNAGPERRIVLDGSRSECAWQTDADAVEPGIMGPGTLESPRMPVLFSSGYVANSNSSHWMPNASDRITGMPRIIGDEGTERSIRTRHTFRAIEEQLARGPFTREAMQGLVLSNRSEAAELAAEDTLALCRSSATGRMTSSDGDSVDIGEACRVLASWDRELNAGSRGALLFDRYWRRALELAAADGRSLWTLPFDPKDAIATPAGLNVDSDIFERALADATAELAALQMSLSAPLGEHQFVVRGGAHIPLGGGSEELGVFNIVHAPWAPESGYAGPFDGSTYLHVVSFDGTACPDTVTLLSYSQSDEPASPHHSDQTQLYSEQRWVTGRFCRSEILASPELQRIILE